MEIIENYELKDNIGFRIPTRTKFYATVNNIEDIENVYKFAKNLNIKVCILGGGNNTVFNNSYFDGIVISTKMLNRLKIIDKSIEAESGVTIKILNEVARILSLTGLEFSGGLPGCVGGAVTMNAKAYNKDFASVVKSVDVFDSSTFEIITLKKSEIKFSYKDSIFQHNPNFFILNVKFALEHGDKRSIENEYQKNINDRETKGQFDYPSVGCIFKNIQNIDISVGKIIDELGLKGKSIGGATVFDKHANFIINKDSATSSDIISLIEFIENEVYNKKGIKLEREVKIV